MSHPITAPETHAPGGAPSAHRDKFVIEQLPPKDLWPIMDYSALDELRAYDDVMNCAEELLDKMIAGGRGANPVVHQDGTSWTYQQLDDHANRIANLLVEDFGLIPGQRVLLRSSNTPALVACWFAVLKAGGVVVATMPLLRAKELAYIVKAAKIDHALCHVGLGHEMALAADVCPDLKNLMYFTPLLDRSNPEARLDSKAMAKSTRFTPVQTAADDPALIAFTSGTTGNPKGTVHFHRDVIASTDCFPRFINKIEPNDVFCGSPPLAFTFGLGAFTLFPMRFGASTVMIEQPTPDRLLSAIRDYKVTGLYTAPTMYRVLTGMIDKADIASLKSCVSAGEHLPKATWDAWLDATGIKIIDGIGATEMLHIFISAAGDDIHPGSTGTAIPGYRAQLMDDNGDALPPGSRGNLAVIGPTGCKYLNNIERQKAYVVNGWNLTGDIYDQDEEGYFWYVARADDMIISAGYNISGPEVEDALLAHHEVLECAVIGQPDPDRGNIVKAFVVLRDGSGGTAQMAKALQDFVKARIAPYKYPRDIEFRDELPKTQTGKLQRFRLKN